MATNSKIQWTTNTFNPWRGCTRVSEGCLHCYAELQSRRNPKVLGEWGPEGTRPSASEIQWREVAAWEREAKETGVRQQVFCASIADVFENESTMPDEYHLSVAKTRDRLFAVIEDETPHLDWLLLTKRPQNVSTLYDVWRRRTGRDMKYPKNLWLGATLENQKRADERGPVVSGFKSSVRFASVEPQLGHVDLSRWLGKDGINWVIVGGESGGEAREFDLDWARSLRDQCAKVGVPFFMKQLGSSPLIQLKVKGKGGDLADIPEDLRIREFPSVAF